nr:RecName: Full=34 kDa protein [Bacillus cereus]
MLVGMTEMVN